MSPDSGAITVTFIVYLLAMLLIGVLAWRRTHNLSDYILGGRGLNRWVAALSAQASDMSGWLLLGLPGYAYLAGLESFWLALGLLVGGYLNWRMVAPRLRSHTVAAGDSLTLPEFFERRFDDDTRLLRVVSAGFILVFFLFYTGSGLVAGGKLFNSVFGLPYIWAVLAGAGAVVVYTFLGGFLAVSWTDTVQGCIMLLALIAVPVTAVIALGGLPEAMTAVESTNPNLLELFTTSSGETLGAIALISLLAWGLGYFGQPHILARFMAIRNREEIPSARRIAVSWAFLAMTGAILVGITGIGLLDPPLAAVDKEKVFIQMVGLLFHPLLAGVWLAAILAAIMSTADSQLLVASSAICEDFYKGILRKEAGERELVWVGRFAVIVIALLALLLAADPESQVLDLVAYAWAGFGAAFGPTILLSLYWRRMSREGALAGVIAGGMGVIIWKQLEGGLFNLYEIVPGVLLSFAAIVLVSLLGPQPPEELQERFDQAVKEPSP